MLNIYNIGVCKHCLEVRRFHHPNPYDKFTKEAIHRTMVKPRNVLLDPRTGEDYEPPRD